MRSRDFCYWLQGFLELRTNQQTDMNAAQVECVRRHLALVFVHEIDPSAGDGVEQAKLNAVHAGVSKEDVETAIKEALAKLPKPPRQEPLDGVLMRC